MKTRISTANTEQTHQDCGPLLKRHLIKPKLTNSKIAVFALALMNSVLGVTTAHALDDKGVQVYGFNQEYLYNNNIRLVFKWENSGSDKKSADADNQVMMGDSCWDNLGSKTAEFKIDVDDGQVGDGSLDLNRTAIVDAPDGVTKMTNLGLSDPSDSEMQNIWASDGGSGQQTKFVTAPNGDISYIFSYGMYAAGPDLDRGSKDPLSGHDQVYAYITPAKNAWMEGLRNNTTKPGAWDNATLQSITFPGAHDSGMWKLNSNVDSKDSLKKMLSDVGGAGVIGAEVMNAIAAANSQAAFNIAQNTALTQKDSTSTALNAGIRFFDYRPGTPAVPISGLKQGQYYHIHSFLPGYDLPNILSDVTEFLKTNTSEIVIINVKDSGIQTDAFTPLYSTASTADPSQQLSQATSVIKGLLPGGTSDFLSPIYSNDFDHFKDIQLSDLYAANQRLIFYFGTDYNDSYPQGVSAGDNPYATFSPGPIMSQLQATFPQCTGNPDKFTVFQLQATSTDTLETIQLKNEAGEVSALVASENGSMLLSTKGRMDNATIPWVTQKLPQCTGMNVILNDFAGNLTSEAAELITGKRLGLTTAKIGTQGPCTGLYQKG